MLSVTARPLENHRASHHASSAAGVPRDQSVKQNNINHHVIMKSLVWISLTALLAVSVSAADTDAKTTVKTAAKALADKDNYSWSLTSKSETGDQGQRMSTVGKTEKSGLTQLTVTFGDREVEVALKAGKVAVKQDSDWKTPDEMDERPAAMVRRYQTYKLPAAEVETLLEKAKELKAGAEGLYSGDLTDQGVKDLLTRFRRPNTQAPDPKDVKGWLKFWVKDGALTKYEYNTQGKVTFGQDQQEREVNRTTTIEIKDVGTTKLTVPDEAKKKVS